MIPDMIPNGKLIRVHSQLDRRMRLAIARIIHDASFDDDFVLEDVARVPGYNRQFEDWSGDISGRYVGALALCSTYTGEDYAQMHRVAKRIPDFQRLTGLVGTDQPIDAIDFKVAWGQGRLLMGLLEYHAAFPDQRMLDCAIGIGNYYVDSLPYWSQPDVRRQESFTCYTQGLQSVVMLYRATRDKRYLDTASAIADMISSDIDGSDAARDPITFEAKGTHSHGYLSALLGMLALYEETGSPRLIERVRAAQKAIAASRTLPDGSPTEFFPWSYRDEGCSTADWLMINLELARLTGEATYYEAAERAWRNGLYGNQAENGGFCHHHLDTNGFVGAGNEAWWCCAYHGPKAYYEVIRHLWTWTDDEIALQYVEPCDVELPVLGGVRLSVTSDYPNSGSVSIHVTQAQGVLPLAIRIPGWATVARVSVNGQPKDIRSDGGYLRLIVEMDDEISLELSYGLRLEDANEGRFTFWYGPLILTPESPAGVLDAFVIPPVNADGTLDLPRLSSTASSEFSTPAAHFKIVGLGNAITKLPLESVSLNRPQVARLRPLAEQLNYPAPPPAPLNLVVAKAETPLMMTELERAFRAG